MFRPENLTQTVIALPLLRQLAEERQRLRPTAKAKAGAKAGAKTLAAPAARLLGVVIDLNLDYPGGRGRGLQWVVAALNELVPPLTATEGPPRGGPECRPAPQ
ncbi:MAG: hypothetical protein WKG07_49035 [Hymenobacter sp.]